MMRLHSLLLYLYPSSFRAEYGAELAHVFQKRRQLASNAVEVLYLWVREFVDVLFNAARVHWDILRQDLRYTRRTLVRAPGFTLTAILITGLGIGANTATFSITDHVLVRPLPFPEPDRLVQLWQRTPAYPQVEISSPNFDDWKKSSTSFELMSAYSSDAVTYAGNGQPQRLEGTSVTSEFFGILRVQPALGRVFSEDDMGEEAARTVILSHAFWQSAFGGNSDILGKQIRFNDDQYTVIGVMPPDFFFPARPGQFWRPLIIPAPARLIRDNYYLYAIARLKAGVSLEKARAEMNLITEQLERQYPRENAKLRATVEPLQENLIPRQTRSLLWTLFGASLCVLLIACTNLANLLLAKAMGRSKELTVRAAIGAGRERLVRQLLTESMSLSVAGGVAGIVIAVVALPLLAQLVPQRLPLADVTVLDQRVLGFALLVTLGTGLAFGVLPALRMCGRADHDGLREGSRSGVGGRRERLRSILVVAEVAASVVLLVSSGLLIRALWRVQAIDPGFRPDSVLSIQTWLPTPRYQSGVNRDRFYQEVLSKVRALPGVANAGMISFAPMTGGGGIWPVTVPGQTGTPQTGAIRFVSPGYFDTIGTRLTRGRDISDSDIVDSSQVAVVSESFAQRYWPNQDPIGQTFNFAFDNYPFAQLDRTVVGVVGDVRFRGLERRSEPQIYLAYRQLEDGPTYYAPKDLVVRSSIDPAQLVASVRAVIQQADPEMPISAVRTLRDIVDLQTAPRSMQLRLVVAFATLSLLLAGLGIHGLLSFAVGQRKPEFGLRIALGAQPRDIISVVLREAVLLTGIGIVTGLIVSRYVGRWMESLLAGVSASDPASLGVTIVVALAMTLSGSLLPALRATRADPTAVIRGE